MKNVCIYHSRDLDGWMSGAIVKYWHSLQDNVGTLELIGYDYGDDVPDLSEYDSVIMCDVAFPPKDMLDIQLSGKGFIWNDHHISSIKDIELLFHSYDVAMPFGIRDTKFAACELTWKNMFPDKEMPEIVRLLGRYDCFGHKGTDEEDKVLRFQYGARAIMSDVTSCYAHLLDYINTLGTNNHASVANILSAGNYIYSYLVTEARGIYAKTEPLIFEEPIASGLKRSVKFGVINRERFNPINFNIDYHKDGYDGYACYWDSNGIRSWSLYNDNGEVDCSAICKTKGGGGHKGAAGFTQEIPKLIV